MSFLSRGANSARVGGSPLGANLLPQPLVQLAPAVVRSHQRGPQGLVLEGVGEVGEQVQGAAVVHEGADEEVREGGSRIQTDP